MATIPIAPSLSQAEISRTAAPTLPRLLAVLALALTLTGCIDRRQVLYVTPTPPPATVAPAPAGIWCWHEAKCRWEL